MYGKLFHLIIYLHEIVYRLLAKAALQLSNKFFKSYHQNHVLVLKAFLIGISIYFISSLNLTWIFCQCNVTIFERIVRIGPPQNIVAIQIERSKASSCMYNFFNLFRNLAWIIGQGIVIMSEQFGPLSHIADIHTIRSYNIILSHQGQQVQYLTYVLAKDNLVVFQTQANTFLLSLQVS